MFANEKALGRNLATADRATLTDFGDCARANLYWDDGAEVYFLEDTKAEAALQLERLGFRPTQ
jgi:hypothetical protein